MNIWGTAKRYKNGNITVKFSPDDIASIRTGRVSDIEILSYILESVDCYFVGDNFCLSNYDMGCLIYSAYSDKMFILAFSDLENILMSGKTLRLYARTPDETDRELLANEGFGENSA